MKLKLYKYQGAGNDFLIADNREGSISLTTEQISSLCDRRYGIGADGLMLLDSPQKHSESGEYGSRYGNVDFCMTYYNSDGSGGMMCGNGGRCIVAFAADMGITGFRFVAADGYHIAEVLSSEGKSKVISLQMKDVSHYEHHDSLEGASVPSDGYFLDTGTRHFVRIVEDVDGYDVVSEGRDIRYNAIALQPVGANVNFIGQEGAVLKVRTYEKGVEDETYACGTGIVASCMAAYKAGLAPSEKLSLGQVRYDVKAKRDRLSVSFRPVDACDGVAENVWLTGPATFVAEIFCEI